MAYLIFGRISGVSVLRSRGRSRISGSGCIFLASKKESLVVVTKYDLEKFLTVNVNQKGRVAGAGAARSRSRPEPSFLAGARADFLVRLRLLLLLLLTGL